VGKLGAFDFLTLLDFQKLSMTCIAFHEEVTLFPVSLLLPNRPLAIPIVLAAGVGAHRTSSRAGKIIISEKTSDLFTHLPLLGSHRQKNISFERKSMCVDRRLPWMADLMEGTDHILTLKGFTPRMALDFLKHLTSSGQTAHRIRSLTLYLKACQLSSWASHSNVSAMPSLCTFIVDHFDNLDTLSISKVGDREWGSGTVYLGDILDESKQTPPTYYEEPIFDNLRHLHLDFKEVNTCPYLSFALKFRQLCTLRLVRISPICARRQQLYTHLLAKNRDTLSSVYIDLFLPTSTSLSSEITTGKHTFRLNNSVIASGLTVRYDPQTELRNITVQGMNEYGVVTTTTHLRVDAPFLRLGQA
jgi:hypothetical protein